METNSIFRQNGGKNVMHFLCVTRANEMSLESALGYSLILANLEKQSRASELKKMYNKKM
jgi:hypothetical protein